MRLADNNIKRSMTLKKNGTPIYFLNFSSPLFIIEIRSINTFNK